MKTFGRLVAEPAGAVVVPVVDGITILGSVSVLEAAVV